MFRTGPCEVKKGETHVVGIKSVFNQLNQKNEAKRKLEALDLERELLIEKANAPLKRKPEFLEADLPPAKKVQKAKKDEPKAKQPKPSLGKKAEKPKKPTPKFKQPKINKFFKKI